MSRARGTRLVYCDAEGCRESTLYQVPAIKQEARDLWEQRYRDWKCTRHANPDRLLSHDNPTRQVVLVATEKVDVDHKGVSTPLGLHWVREGKTSGSGFNFSDAHIAYAGDFPEGTRLVITAHVETPGQVNP